MEENPNDASSRFRAIATDNDLIFAVSELLDYAAFYDDCADNPILSVVNLCERFMQKYVHFVHFPSLRDAMERAQTRALCKLFLEIIEDLDCVQTDLIEKRPALASDVVSCIEIIRSRLSNTLGNSFLDEDVCMEEGH